jgi:FKBP-type peptidyl-prolyl cis-trans isomerase SlyD
LKIAKNTVVSIDYTLKDDAGEVLDSSSGNEPLTYLHGHAQIVEGLERALEGKGVGENIAVSVPPKEGYGERNAQKVMTIERSRLPSDMEPEVGMQLAAEGPKGEVVPLWITAVAGDAVTLDGNHPMAGKTLHFSVDVRSVRQASKDEMQHGHVHGPGGHHH